MKTKTQEQKCKKIGGHIFDGGIVCINCGAKKNAAAAALGRKGGRVTGEAKRRGGSEHYKRLAKQSHAKRAANKS